MEEDLAGVAPRIAGMEEERRAATTAEDEIWRLPGEVNSEMLDKLRFFILVRALVGCLPGALPVHRRQEPPAGRTAPAGRHRGRQGHPPPRGILCRGLCASRVDHHCGGCLGRRLLVQAFASCRYAGGADGFPPS